MKIVKTLFISLLFPVVISSCKKDPKLDFGLIVYYDIEFNDNTINCTVDPSSNEPKEILVQYHKDGTEAPDRHFIPEDVLMIVNPSSTAKINSHYTIQGCDKKFRTFTILYNLTESTGQFLVKVDQSKIDSPLVIKLETHSSNREKMVTINLIPEN